MGKTPHPTPHTLPPRKTFSGNPNWECRADRTGIVHVQFGKASKGIQGIGGVFLA
jgi:hypothetical protein